MTATVIVLGTVWFSLGVVLGYKSAAPRRRRWKVEHRPVGSSMGVFVYNFHHRYEIGNLYLSSEDYDERLNLLLAKARERADTLNAIDRAGVDR